jgi:hypothetical protein
VTSIDPVDNLLPARVAVTEHPHLPSCTAVSADRP